MKRLVIILVFFGHDYCRRRRVQQWAKRFNVKTTMVNHHYYYPHETHTHTPTKTVSNNRTNKQQQFIINHRLLCVKKKKMTAGVKEPKSTVSGDCLFLCKFIWSNCDLLRNRVGIELIDNTHFIHRRPGTNVFKKRTKNPSPQKGRKE